MQAASPPSVESEVARLRGLLTSGRHAEALTSALTLLERVPENRDVLYMLAVSRRYLGQISAALADLARLEALHPGFSLLHQERGHCHVGLKDAPGAIAAYLAAVHINPALPASWARLEMLYRMQGDAENAALAAAHVATLKRLAPAVVAATAHFSDGDWALAEALIRPYLLAHGEDIEAMRLLARIAAQREAYDDAEALLSGVLRLAPDYALARFEYARALLERHKHAQARRELEALLEAEPDNRAYRTLYATTCAGLGEHERALELYRGLLHGAPQPAELHLSVAHSEKTLGRRAAAIESYRAAAAVRPNFGDAYWSLANLKTYRFTAAEIEVMRREEASPATPPVDRYHLCFALGKALEDGGDYAASFDYYARGNALRKAAGDYRPEAIERNTRLQKELFTPEFLARRTPRCTSGRIGQADKDADPIFIVGLPRAGSTLLEQILASHSRVEATHELAAIPRLALELQGRDPARPRYPQALRELGAVDLRRLGEQYLGETRVYRKHTHDEVRYFIDKMPNNFRHVGLIHLILPNAKIIDARREPMACCFGNFKQLFAQGQEFTYGLEDLARYYRTYLELMEHWQAVLPGKVLRVLHEDVVDDLEGSVRRMLRFCDLPFEPACVEFHKTERSIRTASSEQVRRPIFREGLDQWQHYEPWLGPLRTALGDALTRYR